MKKRSVLIIVSLVAAFTLLAVTAFASAPTFVGYEAFKALAKESNGNQEIKEMENGTIVGSVTVKDNGITLLDADATLKADGLNKLFSGSFIIKTEANEKELQVFADNKVVTIYDVSNNQYYQADQMDEQYGNNYDKSVDHNYRGNEEMTASQEELFDFIVGDLKDDFELVNNGDGTQTIVFELTKDEMPAILNLMFSAMDKGKDEFGRDDLDVDAAVLEKYPLLNELKDIEVNVPEITDNMELEYVRFAITTDSNNEPSGVEFSIIVTGDDEQGNLHKQQVDGKFTVADKDTTIADKAQLDGQTVIMIDKEDFDKMNNGSMNHQGFKGRR